MMKRSIREAFGIAEAFFQTGNVNRASAQVGRETTNEQEFEPDRVLKEYIINHTILGDQGMGLKHVKFRLSRLETSSPLETTQIHRMMDSMAAITPNEIRQLQGMEPFPEHYKFANKPFPVAVAELKAGIAVMVAQAAQAGQVPTQGETPTEGEGSRGSTSKAVDVVELYKQLMRDWVTEKVEPDALPIMVADNVVEDQRG